MKQISNGIRVVAVLVVAMALGLALQSCGGGGGSSSGTVPKVQLSGTVQVQGASNQTK